MKFLELLKELQWAKTHCKWVFEPDVYWFKCYGLDCLIVRVYSGSLCGYVSVPECHWYRDYDDYGDIPLSMYIHGGITFFGRFFHGSKVPKELQVETLFIGFDCNHSGDYAPKLNSKLTYQVQVPRGYKTLRYVKSNVRKLAWCIKHDKPSNIKIKYQDMVDIVKYLQWVWGEVPLSDVEEVGRLKRVVDGIKKYL